MQYSGMGEGKPGEWQQAVEKEKEKSQDQSRRTFERRINMMSQGIWRRVS